MKDPVIETKPDLRALMTAIRMKARREQAEQKHANPAAVKLSQKQRAARRTHRKMARQSRRVNR